MRPSPFALLVFLLFPSASLAEAPLLPVVGPTAAAAPATDPAAAWRELLASRRATNIARLRAYAAAGVFPRNRAQPGWSNLFLDDEGRPCAMAHLIAASGNGALVEETARHDNHVQLGAVVEGPLLAWMLTSGLTQEEAALVQEPDMWVGDLDDPAVLATVLAAEDDRLRAHFLAAAAQLEARTDDGLELALSRLGERILQDPAEE